MCIDKDYTIENRTTIYDNSNFKIAVSNLKEVTENNLFKLKYVIPYITTKHSIMTTKTFDENNLNLQELPKRSTLQVENIIVFQDEYGNYIQLENYGKESIILKYIVINDLKDPLNRFRYLLQSVENFLMDFCYFIPPLYIRFNGKVIIGPDNGKDEFQRNLNFLQEEFGFNVIFMDEEPQTALLGRTHRYKAIVKM
jgi:hypothetical protein